MTKWKIYNQDVMEWAKSYEKAKFHALLCDPPYHLTSIVKRFGKKDSAPVKVDEFFDRNGKSKGSSPYLRTSKGFMGQEWDGGDIAFRPETWEALGEHLHPGAFGMAFSASRNWHRLAVAIEDAGFIIHPTIFGWLNGQGFPKATNISKQIEKGKVVGRYTSPNEKPEWTNGRNGGGSHFGSGESKRQFGSDVLEFETDMGKAWKGHRYGLQALKPAVEPIIVFQKPYEGRPLDNIVETGAGALNIDGTRISVDSPVTINRFTNGAKPWGDAKGEEFDTVLTTQGRWASNFILDESSVELLDKQTGVLSSGGGDKHNRNPSTFNASTNWEAYKGTSIGGDSGGASRFFFQVREQIDEADPIYYCSKVSPKERNAGLDERCNHPTLKPISLAKYLATLLLPPDAYTPRRILVPFSGVSSEMIGAMQAGWEHIVGIEFTPEYAEIAEKRMQYWSEK